MNNSQKGSASTFLVIVIVLLAAAVVYFAFIKKPTPIVTQPQTTDVSDTQPVPTVQPVNTPLPQTSTATQPATTSTGVQQVQTTIYVPKDQAAYNQLVDNDDNGIKPDTTSLTANDFMAQSVTVTTTPTYSLERATADAAAATVKTQTVIKTAGFTVVNGTAYVVTNIDIDGWAGSGSSEEAVDPIIKQTLLQFPDIKSVQINGLEAYKMCGIQPD